MKQRREHFAPDVAQLQRMFTPASIAVIGATDAAGKTGAMITHNLLRGDYKGRVVCVNPHRESVFDASCYPTLADAPVRHVDCAIVVVPAAVVERVIRNAAPYCRNFVVIAAGFGESGEEGRAREARLRALADELRVAILGPNCLGFLVPGIGLNASFAPSTLPVGDVALLSQSGALAVALLDRAAHYGGGFSLVASLGNKMQIDEAALLMSVATLRETKVVALYMESVRDGAALMRAVRAVSARVPVVVLGGGMTAVGHKASASHTGALAVQSARFAAALRRAGAYVAPTLETFMQTIDFVRSSRTAPAVAVITNAGGLGVLAADAAARADVPLAEIPAPVRAMLAENLPSAASVENPIDVLGDALADRYERVFAALADAPSHTALTIVTPQAQTPVEDIARAVVAQRGVRAAVFVGGARVARAHAILAAGGVPHFPSPAAAMRVLRVVRATAAAQSNATFRRNEERVAAAAPIAARVRAEERAALYYSEVAQLAALYDLPLVRAWRMEYDLMRDVRYPCVAKVDAPTVLHKTDRQGVIVNIETPAALEDAVAQLHARFPGERVIVQPMVDAGTALIIGAVRDAQFGPVVIVGYGGIYAEAINVTVTLLPPFTPDGARERLRASRLGFLFRTTRGIAPHDDAAVAHIAHRVAYMLWEQPWITAIDINPAFFYTDGRSAQIVDMKVMAE